MSELIKVDFFILWILIGLFTYKKSMHPKAAIILTCGIYYCGLVISYFVKPYIGEFDILLNSILSIIVFVHFCNLTVQSSIVLIIVYLSTSFSMNYGIEQIFFSGKVPEINITSDLLHPNDNSMKDQPLMKMLEDIKKK